MFIWIASYPRSGNDFTRQLVEHSFGLKAPNIYSPTKVHQRFIEQMRNDDIELGFIKTHELPTDAHPAVYLMRDGRDVYVSYARYILTHEYLGQDFPAEIETQIKAAYEDEKARAIAADEKPIQFVPFRKAWLTRHRDNPDAKEAIYDKLREIIPSKQMFGGWSQHVRKWTERDAPTSLIRFEEFVGADDPLPILREAVKHVGYDLGDPIAPAPTFNRLQKKHPELWRRGKVGSHRDEMPADIEELFWTHHGDMMRRMGYRR